MIELTVKTLDSQNHRFCVPQDTTVKQLKDKIAESINIPADSQRLIYCGRVLLDEKNLCEYDVDGKVIHLVHRPPPQTPPRSNGNHSGGRSSSQQQRRTNQHHRQPRMDGNAMYLGAMAFPADLMDAQGIQPPQPSHNLSHSRLIVARRMIRRASAVLQRLEWPGIQESPDPETPPEDSENSSGSNGESNGNAGTSVLSQPQPFAGSIAQAAQAATAAAIAAAVSAAHAAGVPNITIVRGGQPQGSQETVNIHIEGSGNEESSRTEQDPQVSSSETGEASESANGQTSQQPPDVTSTSGNENQNRRPIEYPRTNDMVSLLDSLNRVTERLQPFLQQYHQLMRDDPVFEADSTALLDAQRVFNAVSEVMHFLSHAYHAMSDIMCEFSSPPPRNLRCRPVLIQHSAVLQAGIPIQAQINVMANRPNAANSSQSAAHAESDSPATSASSSIPTQAAATAPSNTSVPPNETGGGTANTQSQDSPPSQNARSNSTQGQNSDQGFGSQPTFNITPGNVEFFMEVGPGSITIDSLEATVVTNGNANGVQGGIDTNIAGGSFPWGSQPQSQFIQNLMQAVAGHVIGRTNTTSSTSGTTQSSTNASASVGGQNSQARGNTATHPTTSTQTRSTSRPHVHLAPATMQGLGSTNFDPFLPCNSHHIRTFRRRQRLVQQTLHTANTVNTDPSAETQTSERAPEQTQQQSQPQDLNNQQSSQIPPQSQAQPQSEPQPQPQPQPQPHPHQQSQPQTGNLFNFISNIIGNMRGGPPGMGMGSFSFQVPSNLHPQSMPSSTSGAASTGVGAGSANQPSGLSFLSLMNMMGGQGTTAEAGESPLLNLPMMSQVFENLSGGLGGAFLVQGSGPTLADLLQSIPDHSYTEGESIFADLAMTLARSLTFQDLIAQRFGHVESLNHLRPQLREFISQRVLQGETPSPENIARGADRLIREMRPHFEIMLETRLREEVDIIATANQYNQIRLPEVITLIMAEGNNNTFGQDLVRWCRRYVGEMSAILLHCCVDKAQGLETIVRSYVQHLTSGVNPSVQQWTITSSVTHLRNYIAHLDVSYDDIQRYLVYRIPGTSEPVTQPSPAVLSPSVQAEHTETTATPEPMETDGITIEGSQIGMPVQNKDEQERSLAMDTDGLPDVLLGSETWHNTLPSEWVPIIARDTQRQRRQNPQPPFSDAYLTGMPSKRRKIVTSAKPQGSLSQIIADSVSSAVDAAGVDAVTGLETVTQVAGNDPEIQAAYREQVRVAVRDNLARNPDYTAERFPNSAKYFK